MVLFEAPGSFLTLLTGIFSSSVAPVQTNSGQMKDDQNLFPPAIREKLIESRPYLIKPTYIKFWNDELYGDEGTEEFHF